MASETIHDYILSQSENEFVIKLSCFEIYNEALRGNLSFSYLCLKIFQLKIIKTR